MLTPLLNAISGAYLSYFPVFAFFLVAEILLAKSSMTIPERFRGFKIWAIMVPLDIVIIVLASKLSKAVGIVPLFTFESTFGFPIAAALFAAIQGDFIFYWFHRLQHRFLWRFHSVHHSIENLSAANSYHHWSEPLWNQLIVVLPLAFFQIIALDQAVWLTILMRIYPFYIHSPIRLHLGPLSQIMVDNRFHRIHHSIEPHHFNRNFGALTTVWDRLFGTAWFPARDEWPKVGIEAHREPETIREWLLAGDRGPTTSQPTASHVPVTSNGSAN